MSFYPNGRLVMESFRFPMVRAARCFLGALVLTGLLLRPGILVAQSSSPQTGEEEERRDLRGDELRERIPAVTGHLFLKNNRHEISPIYNVSIADAFLRKHIGALAYTFHLDEHLAITARGGFTLLSRHSGTVQVCEATASCREPNDVELNRLPGNTNLMAGLQAEFSPVYGKINLIAERVLHFDIYVTGGLGLSSYSIQKDGADASGMSPALLLGVGQRYFVNQWLAVRLEIIDFLYFQPTGKKDRQIQNDFLFTVGASFFFPTTFSY